MYFAKFSKHLNLVLMALMAVGLFFNQNTFQSLQTDNRNLAPRQETNQNNLYLPVGFSEFPKLPSVFGIETNSMHKGTIEQIQDMNAYWVRRFLIDWSQIEPIRTDPLTYNWGSVDEAGIIAASASRNMRPIVTIKYTPVWAQKYAGVACGPPGMDEVDEFAQFVQAVVARYSQSPYNIHYWELGNEIDVDYRIVDPYSVFGCWGNADEPYYGGGYYAEMLKLVTPAIKAADPDAQVLIGGLLLDCDPTNPPEGKNCKSSSFLEGILAGGGGPYFDFVSYHSYSYYAPGIIWEQTPNWDKRGGVFLGKLDYLREVMADYEVQKPLMLTEVSMVCPPATPGCSPISDEFKELQADYVYWVYLRGWAENLTGVFWYTLEDSGWKSSGLYDGGQPKPAYFAYQYLARTLQGTTLVGSITQYPGIIGYEFRSTKRHVWILWSSDQIEHLINLPDNVVAIRNKYGKQLSLTEAVTIKSPLIFEFSP